MEGRKIEILGNDGKYYVLNYTHKELEALLNKLASGCLLNASDYEKLMDKQIANLSTFSGSYEDLEDKPNIDLLEKTVEDLCNCSGGSVLQRRVDSINEDIATIKANIVEEIQRVMENQQAIKGDFVNKQEVLNLQRNIDNLFDKILLLNNEIDHLETLLHNKTSVGHTHSAADFKLGGLPLETAIGLKAGRDHKHDDFDFKINEIDNKCVGIDTALQLFKENVEDDYQNKQDNRLLTNSKNIVDAINELFKIIEELQNR